MDKIIIRGAREHNLKNINLELPRGKFIVFTGISGSGKSTLAFDTIFAEGQRRYLESLSSYARQFLGQMDKPDVDYIQGLSPAISIDQKSTSHNPRSTVGTVTEIYDYLRLLYARIGHPHCPNCGREVVPQTVKQIVTQILDTVKLETFVAPYRFLIMSPLVREKAGDFRGLIDNLKKQAFKYIRADGKIIDLYSDFGLTKTNKHNLDVVCDRISVTRESIKKDETGLISRLTDSVEQALKFSNGLCIFGKVTDSDFDFPEAPKKISDTLYSENYACPVCNLSMPALEPRLFSFNSPSGACLDCHGLGSKYQIDRTKIPEWKAQYLESRYFNPATPDTVREELEQFMIKKQCLTCNGARLNPEALSVNILEKNIYQICLFPIDDLFSWLNNLGQSLTNSKEKEILEPIRREIHSRLEFLLAVGLDYLSLDREAGTLSSGESQRIRLASQIGTGLTGVLYILDEPTIGLHSRDNDRLITTLKKLRQLGNTVVVVEHDEDVICNADHLVDFGPLAGHLGGEIVAQGSLLDIQKSSKSLTGKYLTRKLKIDD